MRRCKVPGCKNPVRNYKNLCRAHYMRWWRRKSFDYSPDWPNLKKGQPMFKNGYIWKHIDGKQRALHRYIMEQYLKRKLNRKEIVHHVNGNKTDNRIENLSLLNQPNHIRNHHNNIWKLRKENNTSVNWDSLNIPKSYDKSPKPQECLVKGCSNIRRTRGLCKKHYLSFWRATNN